MGLVAGKVALVTGAGAGIGRAAALKFAEEGELWSLDCACNNAGLKEGRLAEQSEEDEEVADLIVWLCSDRASRSLHLES